MERAHSFLPTYPGGTFFPLLEVSEGNFFPSWGVHVHPVHPPAYAPAVNPGLQSQLRLKPVNVLSALKFSTRGSQKYNANHANLTFISNVLAYRWVRESPTLY